MGNNECHMMLAYFENYFKHRKIIYYILLMANFCKTTA